MAARNENGFRNTKSKSGAFSGRLDAKTNARFTRYCKTMNLNRTRLQNQIVNEWLDRHEREMFDGKTTDELIDLLLKGGREG